MATLTAHIPPYIYSIPQRGVTWAEENAGITTTALAALGVITITVGVVWHYHLVACRQVSTKLPATMITTGFLIEGTLFPVIYLLTHKPRIQKGGDDDDITMHELDMEDISEQISQLNEDTPLSEPLTSTLDPSPPQVENLPQPETETEPPTAGPPTAEPPAAEPPAAEPHQAEPEEDPSTNTPTTQTNWTTVIYGTASGTVTVLYNVAGGIGTTVVEGAKRAYALTINLHQPNNAQEEEENRSVAADLPTPPDEAPPPYTFFPHHSSPFISPRKLAANSNQMSYTPTAPTNYKSERGFLHDSPILYPSVVKALNDFAFEGIPIHVAANSETPKNALFQGVLIRTQKVQLFMPVWHPMTIQEGDQGLVGDSHFYPYIHLSEEGETTLYTLRENREHSITCDLNKQQQIIDKVLETYRASKKPWLSEHP